MAAMDPTCDGIQRDIDLWWAEALARELGKHLGLSVTLPTDG